MIMFQLGNDPLPALTSGINIINPNMSSFHSVTQRGGRCSIPGDTQGQAGQGSEHPDGAVGVPVHCKGVGPRDL